MLSLNSPCQLSPDVKSLREFESETHDKQRNETKKKKNVNPGGLLANPGVS